MNNIISWIYVGLFIAVGLFLIVFTILAFIFDRLTQYLSRLRNYLLACAYPLD